jgi:hypothetical protein
VNEDTQTKQVKTTHPVRRFIFYVVLLLAAFLGGFIWMGLKYRACSATLSGAERQSGLVRMEVLLGSAAIDARRGDFETARLAASDFFTILRAETDKGADSALSQAQIDGAQPLFAQRDQAITLLSRGDAASADLLSDLYVAFRTLVSP